MGEKTATSASLHESCYWAVFVVLGFYQDLSFTRISLLHRPLGSAAHAHLVSSAVCVGATAALLKMDYTPQGKKNTPRCPFYFIFKDFETVLKTPPLFKATVDQWRTGIESLQSMKIQNGAVTAPVLIHQAAVWKPELRRLQRRCRPSSQWMFIKFTNMSPDDNSFGHQELLF